MILVGLALAGFLSAPRPFRTASSRIPPFLLQPGGTTPLSRDVRGGGPHPGPALHRPAHRARRPRRRRPLGAPPISGDGRDFRAPRSPSFPRLDSLPSSAVGFRAAPGASSRPDMVGEHACLTWCVTAADSGTLACRAGAGHSMRGLAPRSWADLKQFQYAAAVPESRRHARERWSARGPAPARAAHRSGPRDRDSGPSASTASYHVGDGSLDAAIRFTLDCSGAGLLLFESASPALRRQPPPRASKRAGARSAA